MTRIVIDPNELAALSALCRNSSYDAARVDAAIQAAVHQLHHVANELDADALAVQTFGQRGAAADALGELHGNDHALLARLQQPGENQQ